MVRDNWIRGGRRWAGTALALFIPIGAIPVSGQGFSGIAGSVADPSGALIPGVEVVVANEATGVTRTALTNATGAYSARQLQPGTYTIQASLPGFQTALVRGVPLPVGQTMTLNMVLEVGAVSETIEVTGEAELLNAVDGELGVPFDSRKIIDLPLNARNIVGLLGLQAGVAVTDNGSLSDGDEDETEMGGQVHGARNDQQNITLDGIDINAQERGQAFEGALPTTLDSVQEFIVETAGQTGGASRGSGAQVQLVTRSGTNEWHGSAYEFYRTTGTSARNYFADEAWPLIRHIPGGSLGGPILEDKLFIFGAYERQSDRSATLKIRQVPAPSLIDGIVRYERLDGTFGTITDGPGGMLERITQVPGDTFNPVVLGQDGLLQAYRSFSTDEAATTPGVDNGANFLEYRFNAPFNRDRNIYISRLDYIVNADHNVYFRGTLNDDVRTFEAELFPGVGGGRDRIDNSKGFAAAWNQVWSPVVTANFRVGLTRESSEDTGNNQPFWDMPGVDEFIQDDGAIRQVIDTWNLTYDTSYLEGNHTIQGGFNFRNIENSLVSFDAVVPGTYWSDANLTGNDLGTAQSPALLRALGTDEFARVADPGVTGDALMLATGSISQFRGDVQFNIDGSRIAGGTPLDRTFLLREYDFYLQDVWQAASNLTVTFGVHYGYQTPPFERDGFQVGWSNDLLLRWEESRGTTKTVPEQELFITQVNGRRNGLPDFYQPDANNWAPRVSFAWQPDWDFATAGGPLVVRGGYSMLYDGVGRRFARDAATLASIGLLSTVRQPGFSKSIDRLNGIERAPRLDTTLALPRGEFVDLAESAFILGAPLPAAGFGSGNTTGIAQSLVSPINNLLNLTISKALSANLLVEVSYVGRFARDLLGQVDIASPVNLIDPVSGQSYREAIREIYGQSFARAPSSDAKAIPFFENVYGRELIDAAETRFGETFASAGQAFYRWLHGNLQPAPNAAISLADQLNIIENTLGRPIVVNNQAQFFGLFGNFSKSNYNGLNVTVRKRFADSFGFDLNYTLSKSLDITSASEAFGNRPNGQTGIGLAEDPWNPELSYALSDFDRRHQFNGNFLVQLPFSRGRTIGGNVSGVASHIIGGWEIGGILQASTGRPFNFTASSRFNHHFFGRSIPHLVGDVPFGLEKGEDNRVFLIEGGPDTRTRVSWQNFQNTFPGSAIARNQGRGPNFVNMDLSLGKSFDIGEDIRARFRWEVFNAMNHPNFGIPQNTGGTSIDRGQSNTGEVIETRGTERVMQFGFRLEW